MNSVAEQVASHLLQIKAIKLQPSDPFTWASGWKSPIYCDNRKTLSFPEVRTYIRDQFVELIRSKYPQVEVIAGVATGAIAQGALVAQELGLPFVYVRSSAKNHGLENLIEGDCKPGQKVVVVEDLISTGGSSLQAVEALRNAGCNVLGLTAIFTYGFQKAEDNFAAAHCALDTLSNYGAMIDLAVRTGYVHSNEVEKLKEWRLSPETYK
ncbi:orotate phosphoribosyltransferase [Gabonibacter chumensis]|uniref:orotate phosphoribosyltransferase n=1 Tax=Gabonibacter chumensis TaxID=2972474 RepID=UPI0025732C66|nr:orotate phosphoribosyltransferase [Gabonibacter chumensis]MCR9010647.1 orotate phosphoribosyltransferase [Gabonibacter chumensis]